MWVYVAWVVFVACSAWHVWHVWMTYSQYEYILLDFVDLRRGLGAGFLDNNSQPFFVAVTIKHLRPKVWILECVDAVAGRNTNMTVLLETIRPSSRRSFESFSNRRLKVIDQAKASLEGSKEQRNLSLHLWMPIG